jgi:hypothetical protein
MQVSAHRRIASRPRRPMAPSPAARRCPQRSHRPIARSCGPGTAADLAHSHSPRDPRVRHPALPSATPRCERDGRKKALQHDQRTTLGPPRDLHPPSKTNAGAPATMNSATGRTRSAPTKASRRVHIQSPPRRLCPPRPPQGHADRPRRRSDQPAHPPGHPPRTPACRPATQPLTATTTFARFLHLPSAPARSGGLGGGW